MTTESFGKIKSWKRQISAKPYDRNLSVFDKFKNSVKDFLIPSWLAVSYEGNTDVANQKSQKSVGAYGDYYLEDSQEITDVYNSDELDENPKDILLTDNKHEPDEEDPNEICIQDLNNTVEDSARLRMSDSFISSSEDEDFDVDPVQPILVGYKNPKRSSFVFPLATSSDKQWSSESVWKGKPLQAPVRNKPAFNYCLLGSKQCNMDTPKDKNQGLFGMGRTSGYKAADKPLNISKPYQYSLPLRKQVTKPKSNKFQAVTSVAAQKILETLDRVSAEPVDTVNVTSGAEPTVDSMCFSPSSYSWSNFHNPPKPVLSKTPSTNLQDSTQADTGLTNHSSTWCPKNLAAPLVITQEPIEGIKMRNSDMHRLQKDSSKPKFMPRVTKTVTASSVQSLDRSSPLKFTFSPPVEEKKSAIHGQVPNLLFKDFKFSPPVKASIPPVKASILNLNAKGGSKSSPEHVVGASPALPTFTTPVLYRDSAVAKSAVTSPNTGAGADDLMAKFRRPAGSWDCGVCLLCNIAEMNRCIACGAARPSSSQNVTSGGPPPSSSNNAASDSRSAQLYRLAAADSSPSLQPSGFVINASSTSGCTNFATSGGFKFKPSSGSGLTESTVPRISTGGDLAGGTVPNTRSNVVGGIVPSTRSDLIGGIVSSTRGDLTGGTVPSTRDDLPGGIVPKNRGDLIGGIVPRTKGDDTATGNSKTCNRSQRKKLQR